VQLISVNKAIGRGLIMVYGPFFPFVLGIPALVRALAMPLHLPDILSVLSVPIGIAVAWVWWSLQVPRWRIWALQHVDDIETLHQRAVQAGIEWSYGSVLTNRNQNASAIASRSHIATPILSPTHAEDSVKG
jgi:hypothetical protein